MNYGRMFYYISKRKCIARVLKKIFLNVLFQMCSNLLQNTFWTCKVHFITFLKMSFFQCFLETKYHLGIMSNSKISVKNIFNSLRMYFGHSRTITIFKKKEILQIDFFKVSDTSDLGIKTFKNLNIFSKFELFKVFHTATCDISEKLQNTSRK